jgi:N-acetylglucosaminyl-diphospho-decaprenol L-rhamnosyltransferase
MTSLLVLNYNDAETTLKCVRNALTLDSIKQILVVDNCSTDNSVEQLSTIVSDRVSILSASENHGYGSGNNLGIKWLLNNKPDDFILLANPDTIIDDSAVKALEVFLSEHKDFAVAAPFMTDRSGKKQINTALRIPSKSDYLRSFGMFYQKYSGKVFYDGILESKKDFVVVDGVSGSLFMMNPHLVLNSGLFDENIFLYCEEIVLAIRLRNSGYKCALLPRFTFLHDHSVSISKSINSELRRHLMLLRSKWYVLNNYYHLALFEQIEALVLIFVSIIETSIWSFICKFKKTGVR